MKQKTKIVALGLVFNDQGEILLTQRHDPDIPEAHLLWDIPGGANEFGESLEETARREIKEETGIDVVVRGMLPKSVAKIWQHKDYSQHTLVFCFKCSIVKEGSRTSDPKILDIRWERPDNLGLYEFLPTTKQFVDLISTVNTDPRANEAMDRGN